MMKVYAAVLNSYTDGRRRKDLLGKTFALAGRGVLELMEHKPIIAKEIARIVNKAHNDGRNTMNSTLAFFGSCCLLGLE
jgi:hypothetical protein